MSVLNYLSKHPSVGTVSGVSSAFFLNIQGVITDESVLKVVAGIGVFLGAAVAFITLILKLIELFNKVYKK